MIEGNVIANVLFGVIRTLVFFNVIPALVFFNVILALVFFNVILALVAGIYEIPGTRPRMTEERNRPRMTIRKKQTEDDKNKRKMQ